MSKICKVALIVLILAFIFSGTYICREKYTDYKENKAYEKINDDFKKKQNKSKTKDVPDFDIAKLEKENPDTVGWIYCKDVLSYPIVKGKDNSFYLHHNSLKVPNISGSIFMDYRMEDNFNEQNCIIYGHNMKNKDMFGRLLDFRNTEYAKKHNLFYFYEKENVFKYQLASVRITQEGKSDYEFIFDDDNEYREWLKDINTFNYSGKKIDMSTLPKSISLSTCYSSNGTVKLVLHLIRI